MVLPTREATPIGCLSIYHTKTRPPLPMKKILFMSIYWELAEIKLSTRNFVPLATRGESYLLVTFEPANIHLCGVR